VCAEWDCKNTSGGYYSMWRFNVMVEVQMYGHTFETDVSEVTDLLYKHRPFVYTHFSEPCGPCAVEFMMQHADLIKRIDGGVDEMVGDKPLGFDELDSHNTAEYYQNLDNSYRQSGAGDNVLYCRGTVDSGHAFLQYWHFEPSSCLPEAVDPWHEGDWEMMQIAVRLDQSVKDFVPFTVTASQHYYGQTIRWDEIGNGPSSQGQDYVGKSVHRPYIHVAVDSHATYFRNGYFRCPLTGGSSNHGLQYVDAPNAFPILDANTGSNYYSYDMRTFHNSMISSWYGRWGEDAWILGSGDGPRSPWFRQTAKWIWQDPKGFNNYYTKSSHELETKIP